MTDANITFTNLVCLTYKANNYVTPYHFIGKTEEEARAKLDEFLKPKEMVVAADTEEEIERTPGVGRGVANTGKVWMLNHTLQERARVEPDQVEAYLAKGFEKGGPKTRFR